MMLKKETKVDQRRVCVRGVILNDKGEIFCQELKDKNGKSKGFWCTPGGGLDPLESLKEGLTREMVEETGIKPKIGKLLFIQQFNEIKTEGYKNKELLEFFFEITNWQDYLNIDLDKTSHGNIEIFSNKFVNPKEVKILPDFLADVDFSDTSSVKIFNYLEKEN